MIIPYPQQNHSRSEHIGSVDPTEYDYDLNLEECEVVVDDLASLKDKLRRQRDQQEMHEQYDDIFEDNEEDLESKQRGSHDHNSDEVQHSSNNDDNTRASEVQNKPNQDVDTSSTTRDANAATRTTKREDNSSITPNPEHRTAKEETAIDFYLNLFNILQVFSL